MALKIVLLLLLAGINRDQYELARMLDGEAHGCVDDFCHDAAVSLLDTVYNRLDAGWCGSVKECLNDGYWGYLDVPLIPTSWAIESVRRYRRQNRDIVFAFSGKDCSQLNIDKNLALVVTGPFFFYDNSVELEGRN